jgi:hypothetical protein
MLPGKTNMTLLVAVVAFFAAALGVTLFLVFRLASARPSLPVNLEWLEELSTDRYRPMMRLLDSDDLEFLKSTPGFQPEMVSQMRKERCQIFRSYLKCLESDFQRVCCAVKILMMQADQDRPDLASLLLRSQMAFGWGVLAIQFRATLYSYGVGTVDVKALLKQFDAMRLELGNLTPVSMASAA